MSVTQENGQLILQPVTREFIRSLHGCLKGEPNLLEMLLEEGRREREREDRKWERQREKLRA